MYVARCVFCCRYSTEPEIAVLPEIALGLARVAGGVDTGFPAGVKAYQRIPNSECRAGAPGSGRTRYNRRPKGKARTRGKAPSDVSGKGCGTSETARRCQKQAHALKECVQLTSREAPRRKCPGLETCRRSPGRRVSAGRDVDGPGEAVTERAVEAPGRENAGNEVERKVGILRTEYPRFQGEACLPWVSRGLRRAGRLSRWTACGIPALRMPETAGRRARSAGGRRSRRAGDGQGRKNPAMCRQPEAERRKSSEGNASSPCPRKAGYGPRAPYRKSDDCGWERIPSRG